MIMGNVFQRKSSAQKTGEIKNAERLRICFNNLNFNLFVPQLAFSDYL